jgi:hypothetical protein
MPVARVTVAQVVAEYSQYQTGRRYSPVTVLAQGHLLRRFARDTGNVQMRNLTSAHVEGWLYGPKGVTQEHSDSLGRRWKGVSASTHNTYVKQLRTFLTWATRYGARPDLMDGVTPMTVPRRSRQRPDASALLSLLEAADNPRDRAVS